MRQPICFLFRLQNRDRTSYREQSPALRFALTYFVDRSDHVVIPVVDDIFSFRELQLALLFVGCADQRETGAGAQKSSSAMKSRKRR
ncbi:hypothetical protein NL676_029466 [Syzygium grande]|nr:hypothetical protein NL676_029466 [Syzygium grande]